MADPNKLMRNILTDMKVELSEMFDRNFEQKGFFGKKWKARQKEGKGTLLVVTANMRRSIRGRLLKHGVEFTSALKYTSVHNEGGRYMQRVRQHARKILRKNTSKTVTVRAHKRRVKMPQRQFIGNHKKVETAITKIVSENMTEFFLQYAKELRR